jgi:hypothetical protein
MILLFLKFLFVQISRFSFRFWFLLKIGTLCNSVYDNDFACKNRSSKKLCSIFRTYNHTWSRVRRTLTKETAHNNSTFAVIP